MFSNTELGSVHRTPIQMISDKFVGFRLDEVMHLKGRAASSQPHAVSSAFAVSHEYPYIQSQIPLQR